MSIVIKNFSKSYLNKKVLENIELELESGKIYGLLGPNGSGKSTLMRAIAALVKGKGEISVNGKKSYRVREEVSYMPGDDYLESNFTVERIVNFSQELYGDFSMEKCRYFLENFKISGKEKISTLSTGNLARLKLALALSRDVKVYLLDEPLNGIDILSKKLITETILKEMREDRTIVISSHIVKEIEFILDEVVFIKNNRAEIVKDLEEAREQGKSLEDLYVEVFGNE